MKVLVNHPTARWKSCMLIAVSYKKWKASDRHHRWPPDTKIPFLDLSLNNQGSFIRSLMMDDDWLFFLEWRETGDGRHHLIPEPSIAEKQKDTRGHSMPFVFDHTFETWITQRSNYPNFTPIRLSTPYPIVIGRQKEIRWSVPYSSSPLKSKSIFPKLLLGVFFILTSSRLGSYSLLLLLPQI